MNIGQPLLEYKKTDLPWIDQIPSHWNVAKLRSLLHSVNNRNGKDLPLLSVTREKGVIKRDTTSKDENHNFIPDDLSNYKIVKKGQFAINKMKAWQGSYGISKFDGLVSPAYFVFDLKGVNEDFFHYAIRSKVYVPLFWQASDGIRVDQWDLSLQRMKEIPFYIPPLEEQDAIVRYLDHVDRLVKRYIHTKQKEILFLEEQKRAIICSIVIHGNNKNADLKSTEIQWVDTIPANWRVLPGKACFKEKKILNVGLQIEKVLSLSYGKIIVKPIEKLHGLVPMSFETYQIIDKGDIVIRSTDLQNDQKSLRFGLCNEKGIITAAYICLKTKETLKSDYGYYLLHAYDLLKVFYGLGSGLRQNLDWKDFKYLPCIVPPVEDQISIVNYLNHELKNFELQIDCISKNINSIQEYRNKLISDIVVGKVNITDKVMSLPSEIINDIDSGELSDNLEFESDDDFGEEEGEEE